MADAETRGSSTMRALMIALVVIAVLGGLYGIFSAMEAGFDRLRGQIDTANRETSMEIRGLREMTKMILDHERREAERDAQPTPAAAAAPTPAPAAEQAPAAPEPTKAAPAPTKAAPAPAKQGE